MSQISKLLLLVCLLIPTVALGFSADEVTLHLVPDSYFYPQEYDKLVLDFTLPSKGNLISLSIKDEGSIENRYDFSKLTLWSDDDKEGFQGMGKDNKIGDFSYDSTNNSWYLTDIYVKPPESGLRFFISTETVESATAGNYFQIKIPKLYDKNNNGKFNLGDTGIFMADENGPTDKDLLNSGKQTLRDFISRDDLAPKSVITNLSSEKITQSDTITIQGKAKDQGGSTPAWVQIKINDTWYDVKPTGDNYATWQYQWNNIEEGTYTIETKSEDWLGNTEENGDKIEITVEAPEPPQPDTPKEPETPEEPEEEPEESKSSQELLEEQIKAIQQQIIDLLNQLIQIYLSQLQ